MHRLVIFAKWVLVWNHLVCQSLSHAPTRTHAHTDSYTRMHWMLKEFFSSSYNWKNALNQSDFWQIPQKNFYTWKRRTKQTSLWMDLDEFLQLYNPCSMYGFNTEKSPCEYYKIHVKLTRILRYSSTANGLFTLKRFSFVN